MTIARNYHGGAIARDANFHYLSETVLAARESEKRLSLPELHIVEAFNAAPDIDWDSETETAPEPPVFGWDDVEPGDQLHVIFDDGTEILGVAHVWAKGRWRTPDDHPLGGPESRGFQSVRLVRRGVATIRGTIILATIPGEDQPRTLVFRGSDVGWHDLHTHEVVIGPYQNIEMVQVHIVYDPAADTQNLGA